MDASCAADERANLRTVKSCGPDASMVGVKLAEEIPPATVTTKPDHRGVGRECRVSRCDRGDYTRVLPTLCTRGCGCNGHPAFPTPSSISGRTIHAPLGRAAPRECGCLSNRHCPARPGDPVFQGAGDGIERLRGTGYSAFAEYDGLHEVIVPGLAATKISSAGLHKSQDFLNPT